MRASTIADPIFGYDPQTGEETTPHQPGVIDIMTIDNLPNELPRDASTSFGQQFINKVLPELLDQAHSDVIQRGTVAKAAGLLGDEFQYLQGFVAGE